MSKLNKFLKCLKEKLPQTSNHSCLARCTRWLDRPLLQIMFCCGSFASDLPGVIKMCSLWAAEITYDPTGNNTGTILFLSLLYFSTIPSSIHFFDLTFVYCIFRAFSFYTNINNPNDSCYHPI